MRGFFCTTAMKHLPPTLILPSMLCFSKKRLFEEICANAAVPLEAKAETLLRGLNAREEFGTTVLSHGLAMPHAMIRGIPRTQAVLAILDAPVAFNSIDTDTERVDIAYTLFISDRDDCESVQDLLQRLSGVLATPDLLNAFRLSRNELGKLNKLLNQLDAMLAP